MSREKRVLEEAMALRYMDLAGVGSINEEVDEEKLAEPVEGAAAGGENLVHPIDHAKVVSDESNVQGVEIMDVTTGEVAVTEEDIRKIAEAVRKQVNAEGRSR